MVDRRCREGGTVILLASLALAIGAWSICPERGARSTCVHDGDTFWLAGEKFRLAAIDAPEMNGKCPAERTLALRSRDRLAALLSRGGLDVRREGHDRYGRTLARVQIDGIDVGATLVSERLARPWYGHREPWC